MCVHLIYLTDLYPLSGRDRAYDHMSVIASENERYQQVLHSYMSICLHLLLWGVRFFNELRFYEHCLSPPLCVFYQTSSRSGGCPCSCQTSVSEQSVLTSSGRCFYSEASSPIQKGNWMALLLCVRQAWIIVSWGKRSILCHPGWIVTVMKLAAGLHRVTVLE